MEHPYRSEGGVVHGMRWKPGFRVIAVALL